jgi:integrase/recombinase XerC
MDAVGGARPTAREGHVSTEERTIEDAIRAFLRDLNSEHTSQAYATPLHHFCAYLVGHEIHCDRAPVTVLTVDHAIGFVPWLRHDCFPEPDRPAKATLQLYLTALYRFYRALLKQGVAFDAAEIARLEETYRDARNIRGERRPKDPKLRAVEAIVEAARAVPPVSGDTHADRQRELSRLRDIAVVETLRSTGCRVGELVSMRRGDLDWLAQSALVKGKGTKYRKVYLDDRAWSAIKTYLRARADGGDARALSYYPVFCGHGNRSGRTPSPLTTRHVSRTIRRLAEAAGIGEVGVTPHYFRHVFATRALDRTENLALVQDMLGHASPATTRVYARTDEEQRRRGYAIVWGEGEGEEDLEVLAEQGERFETAVSMLKAVRVAAAAEADDASGESDAGDAEPVRRDRLLQRAMVELLWSTGCTLEELLGLSVADLDLESGRLRLAAGGSARHVYFASQATVALEAYLAARGPVTTGALFCDEEGAPLSQEQAVSMLRDIAGQGMASRGLFTDLFRGVFIRRALDRLGDRAEVQRLVGEDLSADEGTTGSY